MTAFLALLAVAAAAACHREPPPPPPPAKPGDIRFTPPVYADAATVVVALPKYRQPDKSLVEDTTVTGTGKTFAIVTEHARATQIGRDVLAAGGTAADAAVAAAFALAVIHPASVGLGGGGHAVVRTGKGKAYTIDFRGTAQQPGFVAGLAALHAATGKQPWKDLVTPAIALARDGFALDRRTATLLGESRDRIEASPTSTAIWLSGGALLEEGAQVKLPALATTLESIATNRDAAAVVKPTTADALRFEYRGHSIATMPPPSAGGSILAATAGILRGAALGSFAWHGKDHVHWVAEAWELAFVAGARAAADPAKAPLDKAAFDRMFATIGDKASARSTEDVAIEAQLSSQLTIVDRNGIAVSMTLTLGAPFGTGETVGGGYFAGARAEMPSTMAPIVVENVKGELAFAGGAGGARESITATWQLISNVIDFAHRASFAVQNPRFHHQQLPDALFLEDEAIDQATETALGEMGHPIDWNRPSRELGAAQLIVRTEAGWDASADPRSGGAVMGD